MRLTRDKIIYITIVLCSVSFVGLSFCEFYKVTMTGSIVFDIEGNFIQTIEGERNSWLSILLALIPPVSLIVKKRWTNALAVVASCFNLLLITFLEPFFISLMGVIGASYTATLAVVGWVGAVEILLVTLLLFYRDYQLKNRMV